MLARLVRNETSWFSFRRYLYVAGLLTLLLLVAGAGCSTKSAVSPTAALPPEAAPLKPRPYQVFGQWYHPLPHARGFREQGLASWYGSDFHGKKTSSGEIYDMHADTAAHKTLPLGTVVKVRNPANQREIVLRINDRGPFVAGRIIDLSYAAARKLDIIGPGTAPVEVEAIGTTVASKGAPDPNAYYRGTFAVQVGAFADRANAERLRRQLNSTYQPTLISEYRDGHTTFYRVRVARTGSLEQAARDEQRLRREGFTGAFVVGE